MKPGAALSRFQKTLLILFFLVGFGIRLGTVLTDKSLPAKDALEYDQLAMRVAGGEGYRDIFGAPTASRPPLYPFFLAAFYKAFGHHYLPVRVAQAFLSALVILLVARWTEAGFGGGAAVWAAGIASVYPAFYASHYGCSALLTETLYTFVLTGALSSFFVIFCPPSGDPRSLLFLTVFSGLGWGLAVLTRGVPLPLILVLPFLLVLFGYPPKPVFRYHLIVWAVMACVLAPWTLRNYRVFQAFIPVATTAGENFYYSNHSGSNGVDGPFLREVIHAEYEKLRAAGVSEPLRSKHFFDKGTNFIKTHPGEALGLFPRRIGLYLDPTETVYGGGTQRRVWNFSYLLIALLSAVGFGAGIRNPSLRGRTWLLGFFFGYFLLFHAVFHSDSRFRFPTEPILIVLASYAFNEGTKRMRNHLLPNLGS